LAGSALAKPPVNQIENPNPRPGTNNWYAQSGYSSGSYTKCADESEPGIAALHRYLATLPYPSFNNDDCEPGGFTSSTTTTPASFPNPIADQSGPYVPANRPAIGDLTGLFQF
jgi:hypothetical protein